MADAKKPNILVIQVMEKMEASLSRD